MDSHPDAAPLAENFPTGPANGLINLAEWNHRIAGSSDRIRIRDLSTNAIAGLDAWARSKIQQVLISVTILFHESLASAAERDDVDSSTVDYGQLCKHFTSMIQQDITGEPMSLGAMAGSLGLVVKETMGYKPELKVEIFLPKASLLGSGVRYQLCGTGYEVHSEVLQIEDIAIPTIVGLNRHEREMRQMILVSIAIDPLTTGEASDSYCEIEQIVVKTVEPSAFRTLEALATLVASNVMKLFIFPQAPGSTVRVRIDKPSAVSLAGAPSVEVTRVSTIGDRFAMKAWEECGRVCPARVPLPLKGSLEEYMRFHGIR